MLVFRWHQLRFGLNYVLCQIRQFQRLRTSSSGGVRKKAWNRQTQMPTKNRIHHSMSISFSEFTAPFNLPNLFTYPEWRYCVQEHWISFEQLWFNLFLLQNVYLCLLWIRKGETRCHRSHSGPDAQLRSHIWIHMGPYDLYMQCIWCSIWCILALQLYSSKVAGPQFSSKMSGSQDEIHVEIQIQSAKSRLWFTGLPVCRFTMHLRADISAARRGGRSPQPKFQCSSTFCREGEGIESCYEAQRGRCAHMISAALTVKRSS